MNAEEIRYMLAKQVQTMREIETQYGVISLDDYELFCAVEEALNRVLGERLKKLEGAK